MRFSTALLFSALAVLTSAQNPFTRVTYTGFTVGTPINITWTPTTQSTVSLILVQGNPGALNKVMTLVSALPNQGFYLWTPAGTIVKGNDYALEIVDDSNQYITNYTPLFAIDSPLLQSLSTGSATASLTSASQSSSVASSSASASASTMVTSTASGSAKTTSGSASSTGSATAASTVSSSSSSKAAAHTMGAQMGGAVLGLVGAVMAVL